MSGIVLAPLDEAALTQPVAEAKQKKIPVLIFDSGLKGNDYISFVATDNLKGGRLGGERLAQSLGGKGKVILLRYAEGHDSTGKREQGFLDAMKANPGIEVVSSNQYGGADVEGAYKKAEALLTTYKKPDGSLGIDGIFTPNESVSFAMLRVLQDNGWAGKVKFVGFDASPNLITGLRNGAIDGLVVQDPGPDGIHGGEDDGGAPEGPADREVDRHRRPRGHQGQHGHAGDQVAARARPVEEMSLFEMRGIRKAFGATVALDGVDLAVAPGEICGLVGQNGAGKSTLMAILAGALHPDAGTMALDGRPYAPRSPIEARRAGVAMIYQELSLAPHLSVMENILLGAEPTRFGLVDYPRCGRSRARHSPQLGHDDINPDAPVDHCPSPRSSSSRSRGPSRSAAASSCSTNRRAVSDSTTCGGCSRCCGG